MFILFFAVASCKLNKNSTHLDDSAQMSVRLTNRRHHFTALSLTGLLQLLIALPIIILLIVFARTDLNGALSPFLAGLLAGIVGILVRPTRLTSMILVDIIFNTLAIATCFLAAGMTGIYGNAVHLDDFDQLRVTEGTSGSEGGDCIFVENFGFRSSMQPLNKLLPYMYVQYVCIYTCIYLYNHNLIIFLCMHV